MRVYISGPMTGIEEFNYPAFFQAESFINTMTDGWEVINPAALDAGDTSKTWGWYIARDLIAMLENGGVNALAMLPGWEKSKGARIEVFVAQALGMKFYDALTLEDITDTIWKLNLRFE